MKIRQIFTVIREYQTNSSLEEENGRLLHVLDDAGEFLYGGGSEDETLEVKFKIKKGKKWVNYDPESEKIS